MVERRATTSNRRPRSAAGTTADAAATARTPHSLAAVGVSEPEEDAYRALLQLGDATAAEVARAIGATVHRAQTLLDALEAKGLATHAPEHPRRYLPASPDIAVGALLRQQEDKLAQVRSAMADLGAVARSRAPSAKREQMVELITSRAAVSHVFAQIQSTLQLEVICLQRAPVLFSSFEATDPSQRQALDRGVVMRSIADEEFLALDGAVHRLRSDIEAGEQVRVFPSLPFKMIVADRRVGLIPLNLHEPDGPSLLLRPSALLDALCALFEILWERSTPISFGARGKLRSSPAAPGMPALSNDLVTLLAAGLNDKSIAHELGVSSSTLNRRIAELMANLDTRTRFQTGWLAALKIAAK